MLCLEPSHPPCRSPTHQKPNTSHLTTARENHHHLIADWSQGDSLDFLFVFRVWWLLLSTVKWQLSSKLHFTTIRTLQNEQKLLKILARFWFFPADTHGINRRFTETGKYVLQLKQKQLLDCLNVVKRLSSRYCLETSLSNNRLHRWYSSQNQNNSKSYTWKNENTQRVQTSWRQHIARRQQLDCENSIWLWTGIRIATIIRSTGGLQSLHFSNSINENYNPMTS